MPSVMESPLHSHPFVSYSLTELLCEHWIRQRMHWKEGREDEEKSQFIFDASNSHWIESDHERIQSYFNMRSHEEREMDYLVSLIGWVQVRKEEGPLSSLSLSLYAIGHPFVSHYAMVGLHLLPQGRNRDEGKDKNEEKINGEGIRRFEQMIER